MHLNHNHASLALPTLGLACIGMRGPIQGSADYTHAAAVHAGLQPLQLRSY